MRRFGSWMLTAVLMALALAAVGCKEGVPQTALDLFIERVSSLEAEQQEETLRNLAVDGNPEAPFANYMIGNNFYSAAGALAMESGWNGVEVNASLDSAEFYFTRALAQDSTFLEAMVNLGSLWDDRSDQMGSREDRQTRNERAEYFYRMALKQDPLDEKARCNLGALYLRQRQTADALQEFQTVLDNNPRSSLAHYNLAIMFAEQKIYREAIREWEMAVKFDPEGDIGERSRDNIQIVKDLMNAPAPDQVK